MQDKWDLMRNWNLVLPPSRPSVWYLNHILSVLQDIDRAAPVAVLGSTPEFRDLLYESGFMSIYVFDKNINFHAAMSEARIYRNEEHLIAGDWLSTLPTFGDKFALILSDLTSGNIAYTDRRTFYSLVTNVLIQGGIFCDKVLTHPGANIGVGGIVDRYKKLPFNLLYVNYFSCEMLFCSELLDIKQLVDTTLFYSILEEHVTNKRVQAFVQGAKNITPPDCVWYYGRKWEDLQQDYCSQLETIAVNEEEVWSPYHGHLKYYTLMKR